MLFITVSLPPMWLNSMPLPSVVDPSYNTVHAMSADDVEAMSLSQRSQRTSETNHCRVGCM